MIFISKDTAYEISNALDDVDLDALYNIYLLRCLTPKQMFDLFYSKTNSYKYFINISLKSLIDKKLLEEIKFKKDNTAMFLTKFGVEVIREAFDLPVNILDDSMNLIKRGYYTASELRMKPRLINHQVNLNQFMIDFKAKYKKTKNKTSFKYFDEKYVSQYSRIRPDGLIRMGDMDFFLEMDMSTESKAQLIDKWKNYRSFLTSKEYEYRERKIIVLFIIEGKSNIENRKKIVRKTAKDEFLELFNEYFDMVVGSKEEILKIMLEELIPNISYSNKNIKTLKSLFKNKHKFSVSAGNLFENKLRGISYTFYLRKFDENNNILFENNKAQEYLVDYYQNNNMSVLNKLDYLSKINSIFKYSYNREISYLIVCEDIKALYEDLKLFDLILKENVYFSTIDRLKDFPFDKALFNFDSTGSIYSYKNTGLRERIYLINT